jgi:alpha-1,6-mannosyltransferase
VSEDIRTGRAALAVLLATTAAAIPLGAVSHAPLQLPLLIVALVAFGLVLHRQRRTPFLSRRVVVGASAVLLTLAVATPPSSSKDVWAYVMYGRIVAVHHANPYVRPPAAYPSDPTLGRIAPAWRGTRSVYGPAFTGASAAGMAVAGDSPLAQRLFFQLLSGLAVMLALVLLARRGADSGALALIGLNPVVLAVVAGGHNDLLIGVAVLAGVLAARERRPALAGLLLAVAVLVKLTAVLPLVAVVTWLAFRRGLRAGARAAATAAATVVVGYALGGGTTALEPLRQASSNRSKASLWSFPVSWIERSLLGMRTTNVHAVTSVAVAAVAVLAVVVVAARLRDVDPAVAAGGAVLVYLLAAAYVLPWYAAWGLPVLALAWRSRLALIAQLQASVLLLVYVDRPGVHSAVLHDVVGAIATHVVPVLEAAALVALVVVSARRLRATRTEAFA